MPGGRTKILVEKKGKYVTVAPFFPAFLILLYKPVLILAYSTVEVTIATSPCNVVYISMMSKIVHSMVCQECKLYITTLTYISTNADVHIS